MGMYVVGIVLLLGFCMLLANSLKSKPMMDVLLFSILLVVSGQSIITFSEEGALFYIGAILSVLGFLLGIMRFFLGEQEKEKQKI